jgi:hypothetical protein
MVVLQCWIAQGLQGYIGNLLQKIATCLKHIFRNGRHGKQPKFSQVPFPKKNTKNEQKNNFLHTPQGTPSIYIMSRKGSYRRGQKRQTTKKQYDFHEYHVVGSVLMVLKIMVMSRIRNFPDLAILSDGMVQTRGL